MKSLRAVAQKCGARRTFEFWRHGQIFQSDVALKIRSKAFAGFARRFIVLMSLQPAIPWLGALQHCSPPLHRLATIFKPSKLSVNRFLQEAPKIFSGLPGSAKANYQHPGGPNYVIEVGHAGCANSEALGSPGAV